MTDHHILPKPSPMLIPMEYFRPKTRWEVGEFQKISAVTLTKEFLVSEISETLLEFLGAHKADILSINYYYYMIDTTELHY